MRHRGKLYMRAVPIYSPSLPYPPQLSNKSGTHPFPPVGLTGESLLRKAAIEPASSQFGREEAMNSGLSFSQGCRPVCSFPHHPSCISLFPCLCVCVCVPYSILLFAFDRKFCLLNWMRVTFFNNKFFS